MPDLAYHCSSWAQLSPKPVIWLGDTLATLRACPQDVQDEVVQINRQASHRALQVALLVPLVAALLGLATAFRMLREPEPARSAAAEGMVLG